MTPIEVLINSKPFRLNPKDSVGKGGEADVFKYGPDHVVKVWKDETHLDFANDKIGGQAAKLKIIEHQQKMRAFPKGLPRTVMQPLNLAVDKKGKIVGYVMDFVKGAEPILRYGEKGFRETGGIKKDAIVKIFRGLYDSVNEIHKAGIVIGDFNELNVLVIPGGTTYVIDADSFQFGPYLCKLFTEKFVDPVLCDPKNDRPSLIKPHTSDSDWYAYTIMLMQCLLYVGPYGGVYKPSDPKRRLTHPERLMKRVTVFHPEVKYPKPAIPYKTLPDDVLHYLENVFTKDKRGAFPSHLLDVIETGQPAKVAGPSIHRAVTQVHGTVTVTNLFNTKGIILFGSHQEGKMHWLYHEDNKYKREDGRVVLEGPLDPGYRFRIIGDKTLIGKAISGEGSGAVVVMAPDTNPLAATVSQVVRRQVVDTYGNVPVFDVNNMGLYWISGGKLRTDDLTLEGCDRVIGEVLDRQTIFWVGEEMAFGFYRAGDVDIEFVFNPKKGGINDNVKGIRLSGQLIDSSCFFHKDRAWFVISSQEKGKMLNRCYLLRANGTVEATAQAEAGDGDSWLGTVRGKSAVGNALLAATDDGIVRVEAVGSKLQVVKTFPDTENMVSSNCHLFPGTGGLYVLSGHNVRLLELN